MIKIGQRIAALRTQKGWSQRDLAEHCGWDSSSRIGNYERDTREPSLHDIDVIARALGVSSKELLFGEEGAHSAREVHIPNNVAEAQSGEGQVAVGLYGLQLSERCEWVWAPRAEGPQFLSKHFIQEKSLDTTKLTGLLARDDTMKPYIASGDVVVIDTGDTAPKDDKVYVVGFEGEWFIRRIFKQPGGGMVLHPDNAQSRELKLSAEEVGMVRIFGHVVWRGG